jgi:hypothetical protein
MTARFWLDAMPGPGVFYSRPPRRSASGLIPAGERGRGAAEAPAPPRERSSSLCIDDEKR